MCIRDSLQLLIELENAIRIVAHDLLKRSRTEIELLGLVDSADRIDNGPVGAKHELVLAVSIRVMHNLLRPVLRRIGVSAHVDIGVLPAHGDHFVRPRHAKVHSDQAQFREMDRNAVQRDRPRDARQPAILLIDQVLADLHHDRNIELDALGVDWEDIRMVGRDIEPVRVIVRAHETELFNRIFEIVELLHPERGVDARQSGKTIRVSLADSIDLLIGNVNRAAHMQVAHPRSREERALDTGLVLLLDVLLDRKAIPDLRVHANLRLEPLVDGVKAVGDDVGRVEVRDQIDIATHCQLRFTSVPN